MIDLGIVATFEPAVMVIDHSASPFTESARFRKGHLLPEDTRPTAPFLIIHQPIVWIRKN
ncbi:hypothetical protein [Shinella sp.]|uniref:hypothetical protein n=1 Tax=Shinella sp. TaxID=1870904 RepID=UPI003F6EA6B5